MNLTDLSIGQKRAAHSLAAVEGLKGLDCGQIEAYVQQFPSLEWLFKLQNIDKGKFDSYVERLPATIVTNGLGQAMAFELAASRLGKGDRKPDERAHELLYYIVESWLQECGICTKGKDLMKTIVDSSQEVYVRAQYETLAYLDWLKMFTQAYLKED
jgi:CRISPR-associated protein Cmr5